MKLNIGCGKNFEPDYFNIDLYEDLIADTKMSALDLEFEDNSCQEIKAIQLIEHLGLYQSIYALSEFFRVLQPRGKLILETPDLEKAFRTYINSDYEQKKDILSWIFGLPHKGLEHKFCFPLQLLHEILEKIGFENVNYTRFYNSESIPTLKFEVNKPEVNEFVEIFQIFSHIRKKILKDKLIDFKDLFTTKEKEDLLNMLLKETLGLMKNRRIKSQLNYIKRLLIISPQIVKIFIEETETTKIFSNLERIQILELTDFLIKFDFHKILLNALMKAPLIPGSQKVLLSSIESFGLEMIDKLLSPGAGKEEMTKKLNELAQNLKDYDLSLFSANIIKRKSLDFFYLGIKSFYKQEYETALNEMLTAIKMYRDNFLYYWNLAKIMANLNLKQKAIKNYKRTLKLLYITKLTNKSQIKDDIKAELESIRKPKVESLLLKPISTLDKYEFNKLI